MRSTRTHLASRSTIERFSTPTCPVNWVRRSSILGVARVCAVVCPYGEKTLGELLGEGPSGERARRSASIQCQHHMGQATAMPSMHSHCGSGGRSRVHREGRTDQGSILVNARFENGKFKCWRQNSHRPKMGRSRGPANDQEQSTPEQQILSEIKGAVELSPFPVLARHRAAR